MSEVLDIRDYDADHDRHRLRSVRGKVGEQGDPADRRGGRFDPRQTPFNNSTDRLQESF